MQQSFRHTITGLLLFITLLTGPFSVLAQKAGGVKTGGGTTASNTAPKGSNGECKGNYTGVVNYQRKIVQSTSGRSGSTYNRTYTYNSQIQITDNGLTQGSIYKDYNGIGGSFNFMGKASATMSEDLNDTQISEKDDYCKLTLAGGKDKRHIRCQSVFTRNTQAQGSGDVNVFLGFRGDKYKISLDNPAVSGQGGETSNSSCSGTCSPDKPINSSRQLTITNDKQSGTYTDDQPLDINNLNRISGSFTRTSGNETVTITWNLARCAPPMQLNHITFDHHVFPDANNWHGVDSMHGTTDGNIVKVKANVFNNTGATGYATVKFSDATTGEPLPDGNVSVAIDAGASKDVEYEWDTSGYAWDENQKPVLSRQIKAEIQGGESKTEKIKILPKPIVMAHGLWSNHATWAPYTGVMREKYSFAWRGYAVGADPEHGLMNTGDHPGNMAMTNTVYQNAQELAKQIKHAREENNAWHIDLVAHSMGGLISRQYINSMMPPVFDGKPEVTHLVQLGTPNMGSPCADTATELAESQNFHNMMALRELKPIIVRAFNTRVTDRKGVKFSVMIGVVMPRTCLDENAPGDGVVPWQSARFNISDHRYVARIHIEMTGREDFEWFVMPRIAIGPKKAQSEQNTAWLENRLDNNFAGIERADNDGIFHNASYQPEQDGEQTGPKLSMSQKVELPANGSKEIDFAVTDGNYAGILLLATPAVQATLTDASGAIVGQSKGGMEALTDIFRTIEVRKQFTAGSWKLKLENLGNLPATALVGGRSATAAAGGFNIEARKASAAGIVPLTAKWTENGAPVLNGKVTAVVNSASETTLYDDGKHGDGQAGDGVYGGVTAKLGAGNYSVNAKGEAGNLVREAVAIFDIGSSAAGASSSAAKPAAAKPAARPSARKKR